MARQFPPSKIFCSKRVGSAGIGGQRSSVSVAVADWRPAVALFMLLSLVLLLSGCSQERIQANKFLQAGSYASAAEAYSDLAQSESGQSRDHIYAAYAWYKAGQAEKALSLFSPLRENWRIKEYADYWSGLILLELGNGEQALDIWRDHSTSKVQVWRAMNDIVKEMEEKGISTGPESAAEINDKISRAFYLWEYMDERSRFGGRYGERDVPLDTPPFIRPEPYLP